MRARSANKFAVVVVAGCLVAWAGLGWAQYGSRSGAQGNPPGTRPQSDLDPSTEMNPSFAAKRMSSLNAERQKALVSDTAKLVRLARELDAEIASNSTEDLTPEELHKVTEIEKLARNVKAKMAQSFGGGPDLRPLAIPVGDPARQ